MSDSPTPRLLHEFFLRSAERVPDGVAVDIPPGVGRPDRKLITYRELEELSARIAAGLARLVRGECIVAILLPRYSPLLIASQLAVLRCGAAYLCLDPAMPAARVQELLAGSGAVVLLTDAEAAEMAARPSGNELPTPAWLTPESLAYTIYTSGTTSGTTAGSAGRPKAVMVEHRAIVNLIASDVAEFQLTPGVRVAQGSSAAYDSSVEETWLALAAGATVVAMDDDAVRLGPDVIGWLRRERIGVFCPPPTLLRASGCENPAAELPDLRLLYVGGEALPQDLSDRWAAGGAIRLVNGYGPTECAVTALRSEMTPGRPVDIGKPVAGVTAYVLNEALEEVADGVWGELCIGGKGLARGYQSQPELTAEKFPVHAKLGRIYRTGDLAHRDSAGNYHYHGRADSQVKIRGYRVELEEIEARLASFAGVRTAACRLQPDQSLAAWLVADSDETRPSIAAVRAWLRETFPVYMVPSRFGWLTELPVSSGGKLNRNALPLLDAERTAELVGPRNAEEEVIAEAVREVLEVREAISIHDDFFEDLGGDSLRAAELVSLLRKRMPGTRITVRDVYQARTVAGLAGLGVRAEMPAREQSTAMRRGRHLLATTVQAVWLAITFSLGTAAVWVVFFEWLPGVLRGVAESTIALAALPAMAAAMAAYAVASVAVSVAAKWILIGRYKAGREPVWGSFYVRHWMLMQVVRTIPWGLLSGTVFLNVALRALGARIGRRVHIHRGVNLQRGGWDLLEIGDDATVSQDAGLALTELDDGQIVVGAIRIGDRATLDIRAGVGPDSSIGDDGYLTALSHLGPGERIPAGEKWDGIPARPAGLAPDAATVTEAAAILPEFAHGLLTLGANMAAEAIPYAVPALAASAAMDRMSTAHAIVLGAATLPVSLGLTAWVTRLLGRRAAPERVTISRWNVGYIRVWLQTELLREAGEWLSGTLYWNIWLRLAGMKIGAGCEFSTVIDVTPEFVTVGAGSFFADGIYVGGPRVHRGTVTLARTEFGRGTFLGNHAVIPAGQKLPGDLLLGVCTVADGELMQRPGTAWFGQPPFELPKREVIACDAALTHRPSGLRFANRVFWESLRFTMHIPPLAAAFAWYGFLAEAQARTGRAAFLFGMVPAASFGAAGALCLLVLALKWVLLGRVSPGTHPLWSCWCSRWDYLYTAWAFFTGGALVSLEGTLLLNWYLRAAGVKLGRRVILGPGFSQVVDPDMLAVGDDATVNCILQAHTFEDRVLKIGKVEIGAGATLGDNSVPLYGAEIGAGAHVAAHSVVMKNEHLPAGGRYAGAPCVVCGQGAG